MKVWNKETGRIGEKIALDYLLSKNYELITTNYSTRFGEIDLIMRDKETVVFVEVKTKKGYSWGSPEEMFTQRKYERVKRMANVYLKGRQVACRIDMVAVVLNEENRPVSVKHYANVT
ncbi:MAG: hypothetical protein UX92_C0010G0021 [Candidatus Amesbacteria bacterium GW2011_GWA1_47_20]|uniref:UPF0102 protein UX92_C0010G0021 n=2 Tax=Candidatus Amesiibacteriota TaxID=1752730 RepID=A0A0G1VIA0_9BACT|nr:MAG: hypothetical protein UX92_C0010G0021 [Candidatus Amesbacteria bacterium GW2011_GWA1_47_20]KKU82348.1 MAG: hypothetical protein UY11_C0050G0003 [Candidatus Amesbacteria bacterium GW2011_GWC2_47_8]